MSKRAAPKNKKDVSWHSDGDVYCGHQVSPEMIYVGGRHYNGSGQVHLSLGEAKWLIKHLRKALDRRNK